VLQDRDSRDRRGPTVGTMGESFEKFTRMQLAPSDNFLNSEAGGSAHVLNSVPVEPAMAFTWEKEVEDPLLALMESVEDAPPGQIGSNWNIWSGARYAPNPPMACEDVQGKRGCVPVPDSMWKVVKDPSGAVAWIEATNTKPMGNDNLHWENGNLPNDIRCQIPGFPMPQGSEGGRALGDVLEEFSQISSRRIICCANPEKKPLVRKFAVMVKDISEMGLVTLTPTDPTRVLSCGFPCQQTTNIKVLSAVSEYVIPGVNGSASAVRLDNPDAVGVMQGAVDTGCHGQSTRCVLGDLAGHVPASALKLQRGNKGYAVERGQVFDVTVQLFCGIEADDMEEYCGPDGIFCKSEATCQKDD
jgi:hypothetical protein